MVQHLAQELWLDYLTERHVVLELYSVDVVADWDRSEIPEEGAELEVLEGLDAPSLGFEEVQYL